MHGVHVPMHGECSGADSAAVLAGARIRLADAAGRANRSRAEHEIAAPDRARAAVRDRPVGVRSRTAAPPRPGGRGPRGARCSADRGVSAIGTMLAAGGNGVRFTSDRNDRILPDRQLLAERGPSAGGLPRVFKSRHRANRESWSEVQWSCGGMLRRADNADVAESVRRSDRAGWPGTACATAAESGSTRRCGCRPVRRCVRGSRRGRSSARVRSRN